MCNGVNESSSNIDIGRMPSFEVIILLRKESHVSTMVQ